LFTLIVELDNILNIRAINLQPSETVKTIHEFLSGIDNKMRESSIVHAVYHKSALQASNDKINRVRRGQIIGSLLEGKQLKQIEHELTEMGFA
jgi:hypothetical protein